MKALYSLLAGVFALAFAGTASAQTVIYITGSTAYRGATHNAIIHILGGTGNNGTAALPSTGAQQGVYGYTGSGGLSGASQAIFIGKTTTGSNAVVIKTSWSGSVAGIQTVAGSLPVGFLGTPTSGATVQGVSTVYTGGPTTLLNTGTNITNGTDVTLSDSHIPDMNMADTFQGSCPFNGTVNTIFQAGKPYTGLATGLTTPVPTNVTYASLVDNTVGIVPFKFVVSKGSPASLNNITPQLAQALWANGQFPLSLFTGNAADAGTTVASAGRDPDSGTRLTAFAESGVGVSAAVLQYKPTVTAGAVTSVALYPDSYVNGIHLPLGQGGEASGGTLAGFMGNTSATYTTGSTSAPYLITYLSTGDAATAIAAGAKEIAYNGAPLGTFADYNTAAVLINGLYTFWGYEHLDYRSSLAGVQKTTANALAAQINSADATVLIGNMAVQRPTDGGLVTP